MWETYELENEDLLWAATTFNGGIGGERQAVCGAISASAVCLGLRHQCSLTEKEKANQARLEARQDASELVKSFTDKFGAIICRDLLGPDLSSPEAFRQFHAAGTWKEKCGEYVQFVVEKLYELDKSRSIRHGDSV